MAATAPSLPAQDPNVNQYIGEVSQLNTLPFPSNAGSQVKSANYTLAIVDSGLVTYVDTDAFTLTLPATVAGLTFTIVNAGLDGGVLITLSPNAADAIQGGGLTAVDNKDLLNTKATAKRGDYVTLVGDGTVGWLIAEKRGIWAKEA